MFCLGLIGLTPQQNIFDEEETFNGDKRLWKKRVGNNLVWCNLLSHLLELPLQNIQLKTCIGNPASEALQKQSPCEQPSVTDLTGQVPLAGTNPPASECREIPGRWVQNSKDAWVCSLSQ
jgi:hypothetical protein